MSSAESVLATYKTAIAEKNVDLLVDLYDEHVLLFDIEDAWSMSGRETWRSLVKGWFEWLGTETLTADFEVIKETATDNLISLSAFITYTSFSAEGQKLRSKKERITWILSPTEEGWKIVHCHNSVPIDPQTGKPRTDD